MHEEKGGSRGGKLLTLPLLKDAKLLLFKSSNILFFRDEKLR